MTHIFIQKVTIYLNLLKVLLYTYFSILIINSAFPILLLKSDAEKKKKKKEMYLFYE